LKASIAFPLLLALCAGCGTAASAGTPAPDVAAAAEATSDSSDALANPQWTAATHGKDAPPDYASVFPAAAVQRLDLVVAQADWTVVTQELANLPKPGPGSKDNVFDPSWVPCEVVSAGIRWSKVGLRVKGNSSLQATVAAGIKKYSFKLDFDQFEDAYPEVTDQRFRGFKQLNLNNNFDDQSQLRERVAGDLFRAFGVPSARSAFYEVYLDAGGGPLYLGLYTVVEEVDDTVIETQLASKKGNLYKPEGNAATFAAGSFDKAQLFKKSNEDAADFTDIQALYDALHSPLRTGDAAAWRAGLEAVLNVDLFLKWLAANTVLQNWDTYGKMSHNFYLYSDPTTGRFTWIPWDNNEALQTGKMGGALPLSLSGVGPGWPFIAFLTADPVYFAQYRKHAKDFAAQAFEPTQMQASYETLRKLIGASAAKEQAGYTFLKGANALDSAVEQLKQHVQARYSAAMAL
jgi:spore coat protein CotH